MLHALILLFVCMATPVAEWISIDPKNKKLFVCLSLCRPTFTSFYQKHTN